MTANNKHPPPKGAAPKHPDPKQGPQPPPASATESLPVEPTTGVGRGEPVGPARHANTPDELKSTEPWQRDSKVAPPGSRDYVAGQPVDEEERAKTEDESARLAKSGESQRQPMEDLRQRNLDETQSEEHDKHRGKHKEK